MEAQTNRSTVRIVWIAVLFVILAIGAGGYYWFEHSAIKYERITNAKRV